MFYLFGIYAAKHYKGENGEEKQSGYCTLEISSDTGSVFGRTSPEERSIDIKLNLLDKKQGECFLRDLIQEIGAAYDGKHPDPANFPEGSSEWSFLWQLNRQAYNKISGDYQETYFDNPLLAGAFDGWLAQLPPGGNVLDVGCGHGNPVISRLLDKGFQVTGSDFSPKMLRRASEQYPQVNFIQTASTQFTSSALYDGICSFNSVLYLDPIDFLTSIYKLHNAVKPGGSLFLYGFASGPSWRGEPFSHSVGQWMWSWHYDMEEAASLLEEHGYFKVMDAKKVQVDPEEAERIAQELEKQKQEEEKYLQAKKDHPSSFPMPFFKSKIERSPYAFVIIAQRSEK